MLDIEIQMLRQELFGILELFFCLQSIFKELSFKIIICPLVLIISTFFFKHVDWCLTCDLLLFSESKAQSKWEVRCCLWRWGIYYIHCFGMEK